MVYGIHPVAAVLESRPQEAERIFVVRGRHARLGPILRAARQHDVPVTHLARDVMERKVGRQAVHQGVALRLLSSERYRSIDDVMRAVGQSGSLVLVDRVTDPRNLGAIMRTTAAAGIAGVLLATDQTVGLTPVAIKTSAGTVARLVVGRERKPGSRLQALVEAGYTGVALDPRGESLWEAEIPSERCVFVAGGEEAGASQGVLQHCRSRLAVPLANGIDSLNVAVALGVLLFEARRRRSGGHS
jgi:23S rRNA (guanosine2251-2'-O)-methyltransferase